MKKLLNIISLLLAGVMLASTVSACSSPAPSSGSGTASDITGSDSADTGSLSDQASSESSDKTSSQSGIVRPGVSSAATTASQEDDYDDSNTTSNGKPPSQSGFSYTPLYTNGMTDYQKAIVLTAESYWIRQSRVQYEDTRINATKARDQWRWGYIKNNTIESYTKQDLGYSNCAAWTHEAYWNAFDLDIKQFQTAQLCALSTTDKRVVFKKSKENGDFDNDYKREELKKEVNRIIKPGDLVVYIRESTGWGHVMMYVGNGMMIHCTGSNYDWTNKVEKFETAGIRYDPIDGWFDESSSRYLFDKKVTAIIRPLNTYTGTIPQKTLDRMGVMRGVVAEKLCSVEKGVTVSNGQEITYTIELTNYASDKKTLTVSDTVPENTTYVSGADLKNGDDISWSVTVPAGKTVSVSYTVKAKSSVDGRVIKGDSGKVQSIELKCHDLYIAKTLTKQEQNSIVAAAQKLKSSDKRDLALAGATYKEAVGSFPIQPEHDAAHIMKAIFANYAGTSSWPSRWQKLRESDDAYRSMLAPDLYGGRQVIDEEIKTGPALERIKLVSEKNLVVGDIIIANNPKTETYTNTNYTFEPVVYMFLGDRLLNMTTMKEIDLEPTLMELLCERHFAVIRPSMVM